MCRLIAIVGAGISGVLACKYALSKGSEDLLHCVPAMEQIPYVEMLEDNRGDFDRSKSHPLIVVLDHPITGGNLHSSKGYQPLVFESRGTLGGVWSKTMETTKLQTPKSMYQFIDFPWPSSMEGDFPHQHQVFDYIQSYAKHFDLLKHIRYNSKVISIKYEGPSNEEMESWALWGGNGDPFGNKGKRVINLPSLSTEVYHMYNTT